MIYLTLLELNPASPRVRSELRDVYQLHRTLSTGFPDGQAYQEARCLFRAEESRRGPRVLVQSLAEPDWRRLENSGRYLAVTPQVKALDLKFSAGQSLRFRLTANPTRREPGGHAVDARTGKPKDGARRALVFDDPQETEVAQRSWLHRKGEQGGFAPTTFTVTDRGVVLVRKSAGKSVPYACVEFEGLLEVRNPELFLATLRAGIGTAKGFGFGLLSLAPAN